MSKVIGVGWWKTGTSTLGCCLEVLGYTPQARYDGALTAAVMEKGDPSGALEAAEKFRSFQDSPWFMIYRELDERFPGSKFVLTVRKDHRRWLLSTAKQDFRYSGKSLLACARMLFPPVSDRYIAEYQAHELGVREYFADRPSDLLVVCWDDGDGWEELCSFLGEPVPEEAFPHSHRSPGVVELLWNRYVSKRS